MSETMIERVAWRLRQKMAHLSNPEAEMLARAAIEAMREPSWEMANAGIDGYWQDAPNGESPTSIHNMSGIGMKQAWRAMIDAALSPSQAG